MVTLALVKVFFTAIIAIALLDSAWLTIMRSFFEKHVGHLMREQFVLWPGIVVWMLIALGVVIFVLPLSSSFMQAALYGALLGAIIYGVYDFTNMAVLQDWPLIVSVLDMLWGACLGAVSASLTYFVSVL